MLSLISCILVAFAVGRTARLVLIINPQKALLQAHRESLLTGLGGTTTDDRERVLKLPTPVLPDGKVLPQTTYTSKTFDTTRSSINSRWVVTEEGKRQCVDLSDNECAAPDFDKPVTQEISSTTPHDEEVHIPQGQHLLVDIEYVDATFLNSEERLANAMLDLVNECGLTLLSYHCHGLIPSGISCAGVLLESHVSFHTWPSQGVITLDLFTCGDESLLPIVPVIEKLFSIPQPGAVKQPQMIWAHKYRGFNDDEDDDEKSDLTDFFNFPIGVMTDFKKQVCSEQTNFQRVDVVDVLRPHYQGREEYLRSLTQDGSYESRHPELFQPDRIVFLDGVMQSRKSGDAAYHEALVHPGLFLHENPKRVAIVGGGEGATLREVLKHNTVEKVVMIEIDEKMVQLSRQYLPQWSDCSMLEGKLGSCFEDPRVELYCEDAFAWFIDRFSGDKVGSTEPFDVIIMDALDPQIQKGFVDALYDGGPFLHSLPAAIATNGILIAQVGEASKMKSPPEHISLNRNRVNFIRTLSDLGFVSLRDYEEAHGGFESPWQFLVAAKSFDTMGRWLSDSALVNYNIRKRTIATKYGESPLFYFDGATMHSYAYPSKASEVVFCRRHGDLQNCKVGHGFDQENESLPVSVIEVRTLDNRRGVFATRDIPQSSYIGLEDAVHGVYVKSPASNLLDRMAKRQSPVVPHTVTKFIDVFGQKQLRSDESEIKAKTSLHAFIHETCEQRANVGQIIDMTEESLIYHPMRDRQIHHFPGASPIQDIPSGSELLRGNGNDCQ